jgi:hypothetical protein
MKYEYIRIDMVKLILSNIENDPNGALEYLEQAPDAEWRNDHQCFFIPKGSQTHIWLAMKHGEIFD